MQTLKDILPEHLKKGLTPAEETVLEKAQVGELVDLSSNIQEENDPENADKWGPERTIRPEFLYWLCTDKHATEKVYAKGVLIIGAKIDGDLDFDSATLPRPLKMVGCAIEDIMMLDAEARLLAFLYCTTGAIFADRLTTKGGLFLKGTKITGIVRLLGADIDGDLDCSGAEFENKDGVAFSADGIKVKGTVFLNVKKATGEVRLLGSDIGGVLDCTGAQFNNKGSGALGADEKKELKTLNADRIKVKGGIFLKVIKATGEVRLLGADIGGDLNCTGAEFENTGGKAFGADWMKVKGAVFLKEIKAAGEVRLLGADIGGNLECTGAEFGNNDDYAFNAGRIKVKGSVFLKVKKATGVVRLSGADIGGNLECAGAEFENKDGVALNCENTLIKGVLFLNKIKLLQGALDLIHAKVGVLADDDTGWPEKGKLYIDGFEYGGLPGDATPKTARERLDWLRLQPQRPFSPRPYEQLAKVFRDMGRVSDAKEVLIAKQEDMRNFGALDFGQYCRNWLLGLTLRHGYYPWRVVAFMAVVILLGVWFFDMANVNGVMHPSKERVYMEPTYCGPNDLCEKHKEYPRFNPIVYSVDAFLPVVDLHQETYWLPARDAPQGPAFRLYLWFHIMSGWVSTTLLIVYLTGLIRKE